MAGHVKGRLTKKLSGPPSEAREARGAAEENGQGGQPGPGPLKRLVSPFT